MFAAIIFDWDGTLVDTRKVVVEAFQNAFRKVGCVMDNRFIERRMGIGTLSRATT